MEAFVTVINGYAWGPGMLVLLLGYGGFSYPGFGVFDPTPNTHGLWVIAQRL